MHISIDKKGFTLVETLVAISILVIVILGPMTIAQKGVQNSYFANDEITAVFLAQEAIEAVRQLRDENALDAYKINPTNPPNKIITSSWLSSLNCTIGCVYDPSKTSQFSLCSGNACTISNTDTRLYIDTQTGVYSHINSGYLSPFSRVVTIGATSNGGVPVVVKVSWNNHGIQREVNLQTWVYDHYQRYEN